jgi:hypothetical protein
MSIAVEFLTPIVAGNLGPLNRLLIVFAILTCLGNIPNGSDSGPFLWLDE